MNDKNSRILKSSYLVFVRFNDIIMQNSVVLNNMRVNINHSEVLVEFIY